MSLVWVKAQTYFPRISLFTELLRCGSITKTGNRKRLILHKVSKPQAYQTKSFQTEEAVYLQK